jgi:formate dehydrogenase (coenzyme F420) beta subunit
MMRGKRIKKGAVDGALNQFLEHTQHLVVGFEYDDRGVRHRLFKGKVDHFSLFNPSFGVNGAIFLRRIFSKGSGILLMLRPCEIRAYVELVKLSQIEPEDIIAVSIDCPGAVSLKESPESLPVDADKLKDYFKDPKIMRASCSVCRERRGVVGDAGIRVDEEGELWAFSYTDKGEGFLSLLEGETEESDRGMLIPSEAAPGTFQSDMAELTQDLSKCIMCKNCRDMCPVCYCIDCVFNGDEYLPKGDALLNMISRTGSSAMPQGKELFHLIRMFHVSQVCVGCGGCEEACPQGIPLTKYFKGISERLQGMFSYMSGRSFDEEIPYLTFLEDELKDAED